MTEPAAALVSQAVAPVKQSGRDGALVITTVLQHVDIRPLPFAFPANDPNLCALILVMELQACRDPAFIEVLEWAIRLTAERDDFRLLPYFHGCTLAEFQAHLAVHHRHIADDLPDAVQVSQSNDLGKVYTDLGKYVAQLEEIRNESKWRDLCDATALRLGRMAAPIQCFAVLLAFVAIGSGKHMPVSTFVQLQSPPVAVAMGMSLCLQLIAVLCLFRLSTSFSRALTRRALVLAASAFALLDLVECVLLTRVGAPLAWIGVGAFGGLLVETIRRRGCQARRMLRKADASAITQAGSLPEAIYRMRNVTGPTVLRCPILPITLPRIFISYARSSRWSTEVAHHLSDSLSTAGVRCFLDTQDIIEGVNWRRQLNLALARANTVIALVDSQTVQRPWPAAEIETAVYGMALTGLPNILAITSAELSSTFGTLQCLPVFEAILAQAPPLRSGQPIVVPYSETIVPTLAHHLRDDNYQSLGLVPVRVARVLRALWRPPQSVISTVAMALGRIGGYLAILISTTEWLSRSPVVDGRFRISSLPMLERHSLLMLFVLVCSLLLGYLAHISALSRFDLVMQNTIGSYKTYRNAAVGFLAIILTWAYFGHVPPFYWALAGISSVVGWQSANIILDISTARSREHPLLTG